MAELLQWLGHFENSKIVALLLFFATFCGILVYVYTGKKRSKRLESYKYIPLQDDDDLNAGHDGEVDRDERKES